MAIIFIALNDKIHSWDETAYLLNGMDIAGKHLSPIMRQYVAHERHPMLSWIIALLACLNVPPVLWNLLSPAFLFLFYLLIYKMGKDLFSQEVGLVSGFILLTIPIVIEASTQILTDIPGALLFTLCLFLYFSGLKEPWLFLLGGFVGGISILVRDSNLLLIPVLFVWGTALYRKINMKYFLLSIPIALEATLPYLIDNYLRFGNPFGRILLHIKMVQEGSGYVPLSPHTHLSWLPYLRLINFGYSFQKAPYLWLVYIPIFFGLPLFLLFIIFLYKQRKKLSLDPKLKFLVLSFILPLSILAFRMKMDARVGLIILAPVLIIGSKELLSMNKSIGTLFMAGILIFNNFPLTDIAVYKIISLTPQYQDCFDFIKNSLPADALIYSNTIPPSSIAWYTDRTVKYSLKTGAITGLKYYLYDLSAFAPEPSIDPKNFRMVFHNARFSLFKKLNST